MKYKPFSKLEIEMDVIFFRETDLQRFPFKSVIFTKFILSLDLKFTISAVGLGNKEKTD